MSITKADGISSLFFYTNNNHLFSRVLRESDVNHVFPNLKLHFKKTKLTLWALFRMLAQHTPDPGLDSHHHINWVCWYCLISPSLRRYRPEDREFKVILLSYTASLRTARTKCKPVSKTKQNKNKNTKTKPFRTLSQNHSLRQEELPVWYFIKLYISDILKVYSCDMRKTFLEIII